jgi:hypothetical protein
LYSVNAGGNFSWAGDEDTSNVATTPMQTKLPRKVFNSIALSDFGDDTSDLRLGVRLNPVP